MKNFIPYLDDLDTLIAEMVQPLDNRDIIARIDDALDGQPAHELRRLVSLSDMRTAGAFFTGSKLSQVAVASLIGTLDDRSVILDPACGTGDLLIACAARLSKKQNLTSTLRSWGAQIMGRDLHPEFIRAAKARLILAAFRNNIPLDGCTIPQIHRTFPKIVSRCGLTDHDAIKAATPHCHKSTVRIGRRPQKLLLVQWKSKLSGALLGSLYFARKCRHADRSYIA